jgi:hypothetical protein
MKEKIIKLIEEILKVPAGTITEIPMNRNLPAICASALRAFCILLLL